MSKRFLGLKCPIIQAPMAGVQGSALAIAISNAGGLGSLPCAMLTPEAVGVEVAQMRDQIIYTNGTQNPFNLNFFCHQLPSQDADIEAVWRRQFANDYQTYDIDPARIQPAPLRLPFSAEMAAVVEALKPDVVSFHFGLPEAALLERVKRSGAKIMSSATTVEEAIWLEAHGADFVIAQGLEAGGHRGMFLSTDLTTQMGTFALVPQIVKAVTIPVVAAGGIADAQGVKAALDLGAVAVQIGTAYMLCPEASTTQVHRSALQSAKARHTAITNVFTGRPARGIVNKLIESVGPISPLAPPFPLAGSASAPLRAKAEAAGSGDFSPLWAGQNVTGCKEIPAGLLTKDLTP
ncbi:MAG: NAD(P)H-dependent flavin oxidoreductase [Fluviibacter phosphoraccumulans]